MGRDSFSTARLTEAFGILASYSWAEGVRHILLFNVISDDSNLVGDSGVGLVQFLTYLNVF